MLVADFNNINNCSPNCLVQIIKQKTLAKEEEEEEVEVVMKEVEAMVAEEADKVEEVHDVEEGEISDTASVEEISKDDFNKQDGNTSADFVAEVKDSKTINSNSNSNLDSKGINSSAINNNSNNNSNNNPKAAGSRVWTMRDLYKYQVSRNYAPGLYNLAWAQAVQNKPLNEILVMDYPKAGNDETNKANSTENNSKVDVSINGGGESKDCGAKERVVIDVDDDVKEEGELEEGEIDLDYEVMDTGDSKTENEVKEEGEGTDLEKKVDSIRRGLESVSLDDAEKSFREVCSKLQTLLNSLQEFVFEHSLSEKDRLIQLSFTAIQTINTVFCSMNQNQKQDNRSFLSRFFNHVSSENPILFSPEQLQEIQGMISSLSSCEVSSGSKEGDGFKETDLVGGVNNTGEVASANMNQQVNYLKNCDVDVVSVESVDQNIPHVSPEYSRSLLANPKQRGVSLPLLDLHKDHDADSLPSPTREATPSLPLGRAFGMGCGLLKPEWPVPKAATEMERVSVHPYETDAVKAVSSYQQKFGCTSFFMNDKLPSPTPSADGDNGDSDISGEVSSTSVNRCAHSMPLSSIRQPPVSTILNVGILPGQRPTTNWNSAPMSSGPDTARKSSTVKKTRDPRLRLASSETPAEDLQEPVLPVVNTEPRVLPLGEMLNSRKQKTAEDPVLDGPAMKRQRNEFTAWTGTSGQLEDTRPVAMQVSNSSPVMENGRNDPRRIEYPENSVGTYTSAAGVTAYRNENLPGPSPVATNSLQSLLKDIAVNPSVWMNIIKMEQQKSAEAMRSSTHPPSVNSLLGAVPVMSVAPSKPSVIAQKGAGILHTPPQTIRVDELSRVRMKPRDPRRVLHSDSSRRGGLSGNDQTKSILSAQRQEDQSLSSRSTAPDIGRQFIKNLKNIGDIISVSQAASSQAAVLQVPSTQPAQAHQGNANKEVVSESGMSPTNSSSEDLAVGPSRPQHSWSQVEHLFEGFDDQQKAAIQKERARRIEEQRKMFAARKLCLVLDLDHTLLNSAKFVEVDPVHDEILRKKEEQDREKPQRHLFRFPHMGMWTKLRPGIWNFLEKASQLYELHLYTMGNKLYATEMAKLLDPKGELFAGRVISRGDDGDVVDGEERIPKNKDLDGVLGMESAVVIIDDSVRVWPHNKLNLIVVERYIYFPCSRRQFGLHGPSLLEIDHDERPEEGTLASSLSVIERLHKSFFTHRSLEEVDVRNILASEQRKILAGCRIVFSRVFPVGEANPHLHPLWQTAEQFGAACTTQIDEQVTHVVANSLGTDKVNWALSSGRFVVHPGWVEASALLYRRANELDFAIKS